MRTRRHYVEMPLTKIVLSATCEVERLNPVKTRTVIDNVMVLYDNEDIYCANESRKWQLARTALDGFVSTVEAILRERIEDEAVRLDEGR